jgi:AcrR family transcriptional regulator
MNKASSPVKNKHQARTEATEAKVLAAAQAVFSELGFEKTQLEEVAARAGYTRGAIYAHFAGKEDLFLALMERRARSKLAALRGRIENEPSAERRIELFGSWISSQVCDPAWATLTLEFKLYALRRPKSREKLRSLYQLLFRSPGEDLIDLLFGRGLSRTARAAVERRMAVMGAVLSAVVLESHFRPELLPRNRLQSLLEEIFQPLLSACGPAAARR